MPSCHFKLYDIFCHIFLAMYDIIQYILIYLDAFMSKSFYASVTEKELKKQAQPMLLHLFLPF